VRLESSRKRKKKIWSEKKKKKEYSPGPHWHCTKNALRPIIEREKKSIEEDWQLRGENESLKRDR